MDCLLQYVTAIKKVIGWNYRVQKENHIIDTGFGLNAILERVNREVKRRVKWFSTFQSFEDAEIFLEQWINNYNTEKVSSEFLKAQTALSTFQSIECANAFFNLFFYHFNRRD